MNQDIAITSASGYTFEQVRYWLNSLSSAGFRGERVVIVGNGDARLQDELRSRGCRVVTRETLLGSEAGTGFVDHDMSVARYFLFWLYLRGRSEEDVRYVIAADVRDAVFQMDPATWLERHLGDRKLVVASEGITYGDQPWNRQNMDEAFGPGVREYMEDRLAWNCGTIAGTLPFFRDLSLNLFLGCSARNVPYSDQASLNVLLTLEPFRRHVLFDDGTLGWACQAGTMVAAARSEALSYRYRGLEPLFDGETVYTPAGRPFCIVHQYDRVPYWKVCLERRFG